MYTGTLAGYILRYGMPRMHFAQHYYSLVTAAGCRPDLMQAQSILNFAREVDSHQFQVQ